MATVNPRPQSVPAIKPMGITLQLQGFRADVPTIIAAGIDDEVKRLRVKVVNLRKEIAAITDAFDKNLMTAQNGVKGKDFLKDIPTVISREKKKNNKVVIVPEIDPEDYV